MAHIVGDFNLSDDLDNVYLQVGGDIVAKSLRTNNNKEPVNPDSIKMNDTIMVGMNNQFIGSETYPLGYTSGQVVTGQGNRIYGQNVNSQVFGQSNELCSNCAGSTMTGMNNKMKNSQQSFIGGYGSSITSKDGVGGSNFSFGFDNVIDLSGTSETDTKCAITLGRKAKTEYGNSFVWNSKDDTYSSKGKCTFNVNPQDGLSGFYIGKDNFIECVLCAICMMDDVQKQQVKDAL